MLRVSPQPKNSLSAGTRLTGVKRRAVGVPTEGLGFPSGRSSAPLGSQGDKGGTPVPSPRPPGQPCQAGRPWLIPVKS